MLIVDTDESFVSAVENVFAREFEVQTCRDGETALDLLVGFRPHVLILNLSLPYKDGLTVLQQSPYTPPVILAITNYVSTYIQRSCANLGVGYLLLSPKVSALRVRVMDMVNHYQSADSGMDLRAQTVLHLHILGFPTHPIGYPQLCEAIPLFFWNREQILNAEFYPTIAAICRSTNGMAVERSIRTLIEKAWNNRDAMIWEKYFPNCTKCPSNKAFIAAIASQLEYNE